ncbi:MAG TPA: thiamine diphosphokinase [Candidatus Kryptonia bacterium]
MTFENFVLVFCNGISQSKARLESLLPKPSLVACADGGASIAISLGYKPDFIVGDLDSLDPGLGNLQNTKIVKVESQNDTDLEKTLDFLLGKGCDHFMVTAFSGGRIDHTLANIEIACAFSRKCTIVLADESYILFPVTERYEGEVPPGTTISVIATEDETVVTTTGLFYKLDHERLAKGGRGISNYSVNGQVGVEVHRGTVLVMLNV